MGAGIERKEGGMSVGQNVAQPYRAAGRAKIKEKREQVVSMEKVEERDKNGTNVPLRAPVLQSPRPAPPELPPRQQEVPRNTHGHHAEEQVLNYSV